MVSEGEVSIEQAVEAAYNEATAEPAATEAPAESSTPEPQAESTSEKVSEALGTETKEAPPAATEAESKETSTEASTTESSYAAPQFFDANEKAAFAKIPDELKPFVDNFCRRRDLSYQRFVTKVRNEAQQMIQQNVGPYTGLNEVLKPHEQRLAADGKDVATAVRSVLAWDQRIDENPVDALAQLCRRTGIHPKQIFDYLNGGGGTEGQGTNGSAQGSYDPRYDAVQRELEQLKAERVADAARQEQSGYASAISQFAQSVDAQGNAAHPYFEDVRLDMKPIVMHLGEMHPTATPAQLLEEAYNRACWANPSVRALIQSEQTKKQAAVSLQKKAAATSIKASSSNGIGKSSTPQGELTIQDSILKSASDMGIEL